MRRSIGMNLLIFVRPATLWDNFLHSSSTCASKLTLESEELELLRFLKWISPVFYDFHHLLNTFLVFLNSELATTS